MAGRFQGFVLTFLITAYDDTASPEHTSCILPEMTWIRAT